MLMFILTILLLTISAIGYMVSLGVLCKDYQNYVAGIINFACVIALVVGVLMACNNVHDVVCAECGSKKVISASTKYCDVCGSELILVNEK